MQIYIVYMHRIVVNIIYIYQHVCISISHCFVLVPYCFTKLLRTCLLYINIVEKKLYTQLKKAQRKQSASRQDQRLGSRRRKMADQRDLHRWQTTHRTPALHCNCGNRELRYQPRIDCPGELDVCREVAERLQI